MRCVPPSVLAFVPVQTSVRLRPRKLSTTKVAYPHSPSTDAQAASARWIPAHPCARITAGNGPAPDGNRRSPEITTGSPRVQREPSGVSTRLPAVANHTVPESVAVRLGFRSFSAGAHPAHITTRTQPASHIFMSFLGKGPM